MTAEREMRAEYREPTGQPAVRQVGEVDDSRLSMAASRSVRACNSVARYALRALGAVRRALLPAVRHRCASLRTRLSSGDAGMSTAEYAVGTIAAVAFAAVLYKVVTSPAVLAALQAIIARALKAPF